MRQTGVKGEVSIAEVEAVEEENPLEDQVEKKKLMRMMEKMAAEAVAVVVAVVVTAVTGLDTCVVAAIVAATRREIRPSRAMTAATKRKKLAVAEDAAVEVSEADLEDAASAEVSEAGSAVALASEVVAALFAESEALSAAVLVVAADRLAGLKAEKAAPRMENHQHRTEA